jgi:hypothetical protein
MYLSLALLLAAAPAPFFQRGVNFTAERPDHYSSESAQKLLVSLPSYGVNSVAFVPYGFSRSGEPSVRFQGDRGMESDSSIELLAAVAHKNKMKVLLKPQIWSGRGGPSELDYSSAEDIKKWFAAYRLFTEHYAKLAQRIHADLYCVGVEFVKLNKHESEWRSVIAQARKFYSGPLVYAANFGPEFENTKFWDALDYIGLDNYYPMPVEESLRKVEAVQRKYKKPVIFAEAGFASLVDAGKTPWDDTGAKAGSALRRQISLDEQQRCYESLLNAFYKKPWFQGVYWWKVGSNGFGGPADGSHTPWGKPAMDVVKRWYLQGGR